MKSMYLMIALAVSLLAGCAKMSDVVGPAPVDEGTATVNFLVVSERSGVLAKAMDTDYPVKLVFFVTTTVKVERIDTIPLSSSAVSVPLSYNLKKGVTYGFDAVTYSQEGEVLNFGTLQLTIPNKDTSVAISLPATKTKMDLEIVLKGSQASGADTIQLFTEDLNCNCPPGYGEAKRLVFTPGTLDTAKISYWLYANHAYNLKVVIKNPDGSYFQGFVTTPKLAPSVDYDLVIPLTKYDPNGAVVAFSIALGKVASLKLRVTGI